MNTFKETKRILIFMLILAVVAVVWYVIFFYSIKNTNEKISVLENEIGLLNKKDFNLKSVSDLIKDTKDNREQLDTYFVNDDEIVNFIEGIEDLGVIAGVNVNVSSVNIVGDGTKKLDKDKISELLQLDFSVDGEWGGVFHFFKLVEKLPFKVSVLRMNLESVNRNLIQNGSENEKEEGRKMWKGVFNITVVKTKS